VRAHFGSRVPSDLVIDPLARIVDQALEQVSALYELDGPRAEAWASDLIALAVEATPSPPDPDPDDAVLALLRRLDEADGVDKSAGTVAAALVRSLIGRATPNAHPNPSEAADVPMPGWFDSLGTSVCDGAWILTSGRDQSAAFRFIDSDDASHTIVVDLLSGSSESIGEVAVGAADVIELVQDPQSVIELSSTDPKALALRVANAFVATTQPAETFVVNGRLLAARLHTLVARELVVPELFGEVVPEVPEHDPEDDAFALSVLERALGSRALEIDSSADTVRPHGESIASAAASLRHAADVDDHPAQWLAASRGPVDLDIADIVVVIAAVAACVRPHQMAPLDLDAREAVSVLEWADWLGAVIGLVREGPGASVEPNHMVDLINRCPEVTTTIPKSDRAQVERSFTACIELWESIGLSAQKCLTPVGVCILPLALAEAWTPTD